MFFYFSKLLPLVVYPLGLACLLILVSLLVRHQRRQKIVLVCAVALLLLGGNHWVSLALAQPLEWRYLPPVDTPHAEVIVILAGEARGASFPRATAEIGEAGDRLVYAARLYRQGAAPVLLYSGATIEWLSNEDEIGQDATEFLELMGVPPEAIWLEGSSLNTYQSAVACRQMLMDKGIRRIILVTSASHMPRSVALFEKQGFEVIPASTDFTVTQADWQQFREASLATHLLFMLPNANSLEVTTRMLKEYLGIFIYKIQGWL